MMCGICGLNAMRNPSPASGRVRSRSGALTRKTDSRIDCTRKFAPAASPYRPRSVRSATIGGRRISGISASHKKGGDPIVAPLLLSSRNPSPGRKESRPQVHPHHGTVVLARWRLCICSRRVDRIRRRIKVVTTVMECSDQKRAQL